MTHDITLIPERQPIRAGFPALRAILLDAGEHATKRFLEFFTPNIRNKNTRSAYARAVARFLAWCDDRGLRLAHIEPMLVAAYIE